MVLAAIALLVLGMQFGLPYLSFRAGTSNVDRPVTSNDRTRGLDLWNRRLRFDGVLDPMALGDERYSLLSTAICQQELILLVAKANTAGMIESIELISVDVRNGQVKSSSAPGVRHLLSDGQTVWRLPHLGQWHFDSIYDEAHVFLNDGKPTAIDYQGKLHEFVNDRWHRTGSFAGIPWMLAVDMASTIDREGNLHFFHLSAGSLWHREGLITESEDENADRKQRLGTLLHQSVFDDTARELGWARIYVHTEEKVFSDGVPSGQFGFWIDQGRACSFGAITGAPDEYNLGFEIYEYLSNRDYVRKRIPTPLRWRHGPAGIAAPPFGMHFVSSRAGTHFVASCDKGDGRLHVLQLENDRMTIIGQRASPLVRWVCFDAAWLTLLELIVPMSVLTLLVSLVERRSQPRRYHFGDQAVVLGHVTRRGIARAIDTAVMLLTLVLSLILHPDFMGWWMAVDRASVSLDHRLHALVTSSANLDLDSFQEEVRTIAFVVSEAPFVPWLLVLGVLFGLGQLTWQARSGRTFGKWLLGLQTIRTTLRPCGMARSLLREILFVVDSACLLSWVPGVMSIVATHKSQRIGDVLADTIVIKT